MAGTSTGWTVLVDRGTVIKGCETLTTKDETATVATDELAALARPGGFPIVQWSVLRILAKGEALQPLEIAERASRSEGNAAIYGALLVLKKRNHVALAWHLTETRAIRQYTITDEGREELERLRRWLGLEEQHQ